MKAEIALLGNPNCGSTTLYNELTGASRSVGNWTGVTVTLEIGHFHYGGQAIDIVDLPGIYSLFTHSPEQITACEYLVNYHPDVVVNVVDSVNLERNLYLTTQLAETGVPMVVALNMADELYDRGMNLDVERLSQLLNVPCVTISATKRIGIDRLMDTVLEVARHPEKGRSQRRPDFYTPQLLGELDKVLDDVANEDIPEHLNRSWVALQILEEHWQGERPERVRGEGDQWESRISASRYEWVRSISRQVLGKSPLARRSELTTRLDHILCHRTLALPIFILVMLLCFFLSFGSIGAWLTGLFDAFLNNILPTAAEGWLTAASVGPVLISLIVDGVIAGVGGVLMFLPQLGILFFCLALLESSGYMARAAFITDRMLDRFGLSGMSFIPMVLGFGCSVPAILSCGALHTRRERLLTMAAVPFMSCSARMPVYGLIAAAFFASQRWLVVGSLYLLGIVMALLTTVLLSSRLKRDEQLLFIMEMPPYRRPVWHCVWKTVWLRLWDFISHAGSIILLASMVVWFLSNFSLDMRLVGLTGENILSRLGVALAPLLQPLGCGSWQIAVALLTGLMSKEAIVATLSVLLASGGVSAGLAGLISPIAAYALLVFVLLYTPCAATMTVIRKISGSGVYTLGAGVYHLVVAWLIAFAVYKLGILLFL